MLEKHYEWRNMTSDGLLQVPPTVGPYYSETTLERPYDTVEDAEMAALEYLKVADRYCIDLVLVTCYRMKQSY